MRAPSFWWRPGGWESALLAPAGALYGAVAAHRLRQDGARAPLPVVCVGNPTLGGAGKTPLALRIAAFLSAAGERPAFLTRGYGGRLAGPVRVDLARHGAEEVGDEPLLLARAFPTIVARDRVAGAAAAAAAGASVVVMDDGFQNPSLAKDCALLVVDAARGIGNGAVFPAGPLRVPLGPQLARAQALILVGEGPGAAPVIAAAAGRALPCFTAALVPDTQAAELLRARPVLAFAGIGDPEKFFHTLRDAGIAVPVRRPFPDHHRYTAADARALLREADERGLQLVTTEKDLARMTGDEALAPLRERTAVLPITLQFDPEAALRDVVLARVRTTV